jgi:hypothetical protein
MTCATSCDRRAGPARIIHFPEGATCSPHKRIMSVTGPAEAGPADWGGADWQVLRRELAAIARLVGELRLWTVLGSVHPLTPPHRPHNSMYVISDRGELVTRYDERLLSATKLSFIYTPGSDPVTFEVDGPRRDGGLRHRGAGPRRRERPVGQLRHVRAAQHRRARGDHRPGRPLGRAVPSRRAPTAAPSSGAGRLLPWQGEPGA